MQNGISAIEAGIHKSSYFETAPEDMMARPRKILAGKQVQNLAKLGASTTEIADFFGVDRSTVHRRYATEIAKGRAELRLKLRRLQWRAAEQGNIAMLIFLGKAILGQAENASSESPDPQFRLIITERGTPREGLNVGQSSNLAEGTGSTD